MGKASSTAGQQTTPCRLGKDNRQAKKEATVLNTSILRFWDLKYSLIGPPCYQMFKHVVPLYDELYELVKEMQDPTQLAIDEVRDRLTKMVNDLSGMVDGSSRGVEQGLASLQAAVENNRHDHPLSLFMTDDELSSAQQWHKNNADALKPPTRNYPPGEGSPGKLKAEKTANQSQ